MKIKFLSREQQLAMLDEPNAVEKLENYVAQADKLRTAAQKKVWASFKNTSSPLANSPIIGIYERIDDEEIVKITNRLSLKNAKRISEICGTVEEETFLKMLDIFPIEDSRRILFAYADKHCSIWEKTILKVIPKLSKQDAADLVVANGYMPLSVFCLLLELMPVSAVKDTILRLAEKDGVTCDEDIVENLNIFPEQDRDEILRACICRAGGLDEAAFLKLFDSMPKEKVEEYLRLGIEHDSFFGDELLIRIIEVYHGDTASALIEAYFASDSGSTSYDEDEQDYFRDLIQ